MDLQKAADAARELRAAKLAEAEGVLVAAATGGEGGKSRPLTDDETRKYEGLLEEACLEADVPFLPMLEPLLADSRWLRWLDADGLHLNSEGHAAVYERVRSWPALLQWAGLELRRQPTPSF